jgi:signal transduction histidine kinase
MQKYDENSKKSLVYKYIASQLCFFILLFALVTSQYGNEVNKFHISGIFFVYISFSVLTFLFVKEIWQIFTKENTFFKDEIQKQASYLREALDTRKYFLNNMSHELRTPMVGIMSLPEIILKQWDNLSEEKKRELITAMAESGKRMNVIVQDLLDLALFQADLFRLNVVDMNVIESVNKAIKRAKESNAALKVDYEINFNPENFYNPFIQADQKRLEQVIFNIIHNSLKFSKPAVKNVINIYLEEVGSSKLLIKISDTGVGVPEQELEKIFEPFYESTRTRCQSGGKGFGLAVCASIIELHKGKIWAESSIEGTNLFIELNRELV